MKFNGAILDPFAPMHGFRQGDPLSSFLFLFVADGLSVLLTRGAETSAFDPLKICRRAPGVSHLLFANDTILFLKMNPHEANYIKGLIASHAQATGQYINPCKC